MKLIEVFEPSHIASTKSRDYFLRLMKMYWRGAEIGIWSAGSMIGVEGKLSSFLSVIDQQTPTDTKRILSKMFNQVVDQQLNQTIDEILEKEPGGSDAALLSHEGSANDWKDDWYEDWVAEIEDSDWSLRVSDMVIPIRKMIEDKAVELFPRGATVLVQFLWPKKTNPEVFDPTVEITVTLAD